MELVGLALSMLHEEEKNEETVGDVAGAEYTGWPYARCGAGSWLRDTSGDRFEHLVLDRRGAQSAGGIPELPNLIALYSYLYVSQ